MHWRARLIALALGPLAVLTVLAVGAAVVGFSIIESAGGTAAGARLAASEASAMR